MSVGTLIIGGGLAGLSLARKLNDIGHDYLLIESRSRFGGRIHSMSVAHEKKAAQFDLGPTWFWSVQPRMEKLLKALKLNVFEQYAVGDIVYEDNMQVVRGGGYASMEGSLRVDGGMSAIVNGIVAGLPSDRLRTNCRVTAIERFENHIETHAEGALGGKMVFSSRRVILAIPPRAVMENVSFLPAFTENDRDAIRAIPTWMAGHAKIVAVYGKPFWREKGLSGDGMSRVGPLVEIHDASPKSGGPYALFGFLGVPPAQRYQSEHKILALTKAQLVRLFGEDASSPLAIHMEDWAFQEDTATEDDWRSPSSHPHYGQNVKLNHLWDGNLILGSTEMAPQFGGYLEGALEASESVFEKIIAGE